jgi:hypothetical protein
MSAKDIFEKLVSIAHSYSYRLSSTLSPSRINRGKPGELLERLSPEEREELKQLSSDDVTDADRNVLGYMLGSYPENTATIHTHSIKKDDDSSNKSS